MSDNLLTLSLEQVTADFFDADALRAQPRSLYRVDGGESRWYFDPDRDSYFVSVTSLIQATTPTPYGLLKWMTDLGPNYKVVRDTAASYGTWFHTAVQEIVISGTFDFDGIEENLRIWANHEGVNLNETDWLAKARQDVVGFVLFMRQRNVKPLAVETILDHSRGYAGAVDLVCEMDCGDTYASGPRKGQFKGETTREVCIVDYKTGRNGFYESYEIQLHMYKMAWEENYPDTPIARVFNYGPADWRTAPAYKLKDQTESKSAAKIPHLLNIWEVNGVSAPSGTLYVGGQLTPNTPIEDIYSFPTIRDRIEADND